MAEDVPSVRHKQLKAPEEMCVHLYWSPCLAVAARGHSFWTNESISAASRMIHVGETRKAANKRSHKIKRPRIHARSRISFVTNRFYWLRCVYNLKNLRPNTSRCRVRVYALFLANSNCMLVINITHHQKTTCLKCSVSPSNKSFRILCV